MKKLLSQSPGRLRRHGRHSPISPQSLQSPQSPQSPRSPRSPRRLKMSLYKGKLYRASFSEFLIFHFFNNFFIFSLSSSLLAPRPSFLPVPPSSLSQFHFSSILTKALPTDRRTDQRSDGPTDKVSYRDSDGSKNDKEKKKSQREARGGAVVTALAPRYRRLRVRFRIVPCAGHLATVTYP